MMMMKCMLVFVVVVVVVVVGGIVVGYWFCGMVDDGVVVVVLIVYGNLVEQLWVLLFIGVDGKLVMLIVFKGQKVVVNFWVLWCGLCVEEMFELVVLLYQYKQKGICFVGIGVDFEQNVKNFLQKVKVDYLVFVSGYVGVDLVCNFGNIVGVLLFIVVIDEIGKICEIKLG